MKDTETQRRMLNGLPGTRSLLRRVCLGVCGTLMGASVSVVFAGDPDELPKNLNGPSHVEGADLEQKRARNTGRGMPSIRGPFPDTENLEFLGQVTNQDMGLGKLVFTGASFLSDIWGWTSPDTGDEYAIVGTTSGVAFVRVTDPTDPEFLGIVPTTDPNTLRNFWWDIKTFNNHAYWTTEVNEAGVGIFDLSKLDRLPAVPPGTELQEDGRFGDDGPGGYVRAHNIAINKDTGRAYLIGVTQDGLTDEAIIILDLNGEPLTPEQIGTIDSNSGGGVVDSHDAQVVSYADGREILFNYNGGERNVQIWDVTFAGSPALISKISYPGATFTHQGWLTEDRAHILVGDEGDEEEGLMNPKDPDLPDNARTYIIDVSDLANPNFAGFFDSPVANIDHNLFVKDEKVYQAHYIAGVRVLQIDDMGNDTIELSEIAHMDTEPRIPQNHINFNINRFVGPWGVFPFFDSGTIAASDGLNGLVLMRLANGN